MPHKPLKPCMHAGCPNMTAETYCKQHKKERTRQYNKYNKFNKSDIAKHHYNSNWTKIRNNYIQSNPLCERCLSEGRYTPAKIVHHIKPVKQGGTDSEDNLMSVCCQCHEHIHRNILKDKNLRW